MSQQTRKELSKTVIKNTPDNISGVESEYYESDDYTPCLHVACRVANKGHMDYILLDDELGWCSNHLIEEIEL